ncbi:MAG: tyrosine-type recombinase/integrase [Candidatus Nanoarchaeia archaeon]
MAATKQGREYMQTVETRIANMLAKIDSSKTDPENKKLIKSFVQFLRAEGKKPRTIMRYVYTFTKILPLIPEDKPLLKCTKDDLISLVDKINAMNLSSITKQKCKITLKVVFKHFLGEDEYYPQQVRWIKTTSKNTNQILPSDLLTNDEIAKLLQATRNLRDRAIISLMVDAPLRPHELLGLKVGSVVLNAPQPYIIVGADTKTGQRHIPIFDSVAPLTAYIESVKNLKTNDPLFIDYELLMQGKIKPMNYDSLRMMLRKLSARAGLKKKINPYIFRHTVITRYSNFLTNAQLERIAGWRPGSSMHSVYEHLSTSDLDIALAKAKGLPVSESQNDIKAKICPRCGFSNPAYQKYCGRCGAPLDIAVAMAEDRLSRVGVKSGIDPELLGELVDLLVEEKLKQKAKAKADGSKP